MTNPTADAFTFAQVKELLKNNEETILKFFNSTVERLERKITSLTEENTLMKKEMLEFKNSLQFHSDVVERNIQNNERKDEFVFKQNDDLQEKVAELEDRCRRNNLRFSGVEEDPEETWEQSERKVKDLIKEKLGVEKEVRIERAHRTGSKMYNDVRNTRRTIVVKFLEYKDKRDILDAFHTKKLWQEKIYVNEDFSARTIAKRKELFLRVKDLRSQGRKVKVIYNKLVFQENSSKDTSPV